MLEAVKYNHVEILWFSTRRSYVEIMVADRQILRDRQAETRTQNKDKINLHDNLFFMLRELYVKYTYEK